MKSNWFKAILTNNFRFTVDHPEYRHVFLLNIVLITLIAICLFFTIIDALLFNIKIFTAIINALAAIGALITLIMFHKKDNLKVATSITVFIFLVTLSVFLSFVQHHSYALYWIAVFPVVVYLLLGRKIARFVTVIYSIILLIFILANYQNWEPAPFDLASIFNIGIGTLGIILMVSYFELSRREVYMMLEQKNKELERLAITDHLTGLYNRSKLDEIIAFEINRASRSGKEFSIIMADIDYFKNVNDKYGHITGDAVLQDIGSIMMKSCRKTDVVGRWGGEEFLVVCPETDGKGTSVLAEKLLESVLAYRYKDSEKITMSLGTTVSRPGDSWDSLLKRADDALYMAKAKGRCRMELI